MPSVRNFTVLPALPDSLRDLDTVARNLFWAWNPQFVELFRRMAPSLWAACGHNPVKLLGAVSQSRLQELSRNESFLNELRRAAQGTENLMPYIMDAVRAYATLGEICDVFREVFGIYRPVAVL